MAAPCFISRDRTLSCCRKRPAGRRSSERPCSWRRSSRWRAGNRDGQLLREKALYYFRRRQQSAQRRRGTSDIFALCCHAENESSWPKHRAPRPATRARHSAGVTRQRPWTSTPAKSSEALRHSTDDFPPYCNWSRDNSCGFFCPRPPSDVPARGAVVNSRLLVRRVT